MTTTDRKFSAAKRARYLAFREAGLTNVEACSATPVHRETVRAWLTRGRGANATPAERAFAESDAAIATQAPTRSNGHADHVDAAPLAAQELVNVLERAARRGNATAASRLLRIAEGAERAVEEAEPEEPPIDAMTFLEPERMAELTEDQRQRARELFVAEGHPPSRLSDAEWQRERREILAGERDWRAPDGDHRCPWR